MFQHSSLNFLEHRPWPTPKSPWVMAQRWSNLLFAHWPVAETQLRELIPQPLEIDLFDGAGWIGVVPFELSIRPRFLPVVPRVAAFPEINVRTYVKSNGKPGVWFFSLDATSLVAVKGAQWAFNLPYFHADMRCTTHTGNVDFVSSRRRSSDARFESSYEPTSDVRLAKAGSFDAWLTERYCLYAFNSKRVLLRTEVHHKPWPLQTARAEINENSMTKPIGIELDGEPILHFAKSIEVVNWLPELASQ